MAAMQLLQDFENVTVQHVPRRMNEEANSLAQASTCLKLSSGLLYKVISVQKRLLPSVKRRGLGLEVFMADPQDPPQEGPEENEVEPNDWQRPIISFLKHPHMKASKKTRRRVVSYLLVGDSLYKKN